MLTKEFSKIFNPQNHWIRPQKVAHRAVVWNFLLTIDVSNLIDGIYVWTEAAVDAEHFAVDDSCQGDVVEDVCAVAPD